MGEELNKIDPVKGFIEALYKEERDKFLYKQTISKKLKIKPKYKIPYGMGVIDIESIIDKQNEKLIELKKSIVFEEMVNAIRDKYIIDYNEVKTILIKKFKKPFGYFDNKTNRELLEMLKEEGISYNALINAEYDSTDSDEKPDPNRGETHENKFILQNSCSRLYEDLDDLADKNFDILRDYIRATFGENVSVAQIDYIIAVHYLIFEELLGYEDLIELISSKASSRSLTDKLIKLYKKEFHNERIAEYKSFFENATIIEQLNVHRSRLGVKANNSVKNIHYNYGMFSRYVVSHIGFQNYYSSKSRCVVSDILNILAHFSELDIRNKLDYILIFNYVINNLDLKKEANAAYYSYQHILPKIYKGKELIEANRVNSEGCYIEFPIFTDTKYIEKIKSLINSAVAENYKLPDGPERSNNKFAAYRNQRIRSYYDKYKKEGMTSEKAYEMTYERFNREFPNEIKDKKNTPAVDQIKNIISKTHREKD